MADIKTEKQKVKEITDKLEAGLKELFEGEKYKSYLSTVGKTAESNLQGMRKSIHAQAVGCGLLFQCLPPAGVSPERYG